MDLTYMRVFVDEVCQTKCVNNHSRLEQKWTSFTKFLLTTVNWGFPLGIALVVSVPVTGLYSTEFATKRWSVANIWICCGWLGSTIYVRPLLWSCVMRLTPVGWVTVVVCAADTAPGAAKLIWGEDAATASMFYQTLLPVVPFYFVYMR